MSQTGPELHATNQKTYYAISGQLELQRMGIVKLKATKVKNEVSKISVTMGGKGRSGRKPLISWHCVGG